MSLKPIQRVIFVCNLHTSYECCIVKHINSNDEAHKEKQKFTHIKLINKLLEDHFVIKQKNYLNGNNNLPNSCFLH